MTFFLLYSSIEIVLCSLKVNAGGGRKMCGVDGKACLLTKVPPPLCHGHVRSSSHLGVGLSSLTQKCFLLCSNMGFLPLVGF